MKFLDIILVGLVVLGALFYLGKMFFQKKKGSRCDCNASGCKVPKPLKFKKKSTS